MFDGTAGSLLPVLTVFASLDTFNHWLDVGAELTAIRQRGEGVDSRVKSVGFSLIGRITCIYLEGENDVDPALQASTRVIFRCFRLNAFPVLRAKSRCLLYRLSARTTSI